MREVGIRELKRDASMLVDAVESGEVIVVTRRGRPVARLVPDGVSPGIARLMASPDVSWTGRKPTPPRAVSLTGDGPSASDYVREGRR